MHLHFKKWNIDYFAIFVYSLLVFYGIFHHEMWMDESHHWLVARASVYLTDLFENYRYDGHPILWGVLMWITGKFTSNLFAVQILHACIAISMVSLFLWKAPFRKRYKILFIFTYFPLFEYGMISRNYSLTFLFIFLFCVTYQRNKPVFFPFLFLALAANGHLFGLLLSVLLFLAISIFEKKSSDFFPAAIVFIMFVLFALFTINVPSEHVAHFNVLHTIDLKKASTLLPLLWKALFPIPDFYSYHFWNTNFFTTHFKWIILLPVLLCWALPFFIFRKNFLVVILFYCYAIIMLTFSLLTGLPLTQRICGFLLFTLLSLLWLSPKLPQLNYPFQLKLKINDTIKSGFIVFFFSAQLLGAAALYITDINRPFSNTPNIYNFLEAENLIHHPVFAGPYYNYIGLNNYGNIKLHIKNLSVADKFCDWKVLHSKNDKQNLANPISLIQKYGLDELVFLSVQKVSLEEPEKSKYTLQHLAEWKNGIVKNENGHLYKLKRKTEF